MKSNIGPKHGRASLIVLIVLIISLVSLAWIQLSLNESASQSQEKTIRQNLRAAGLNFIIDLNRELGIFRDILNLYLREKIRESSSEVQMTAANLAYDFYAHYTKYPKLIKSVSILKNLSRSQRIIYRESEGDRVTFVDEEQDRSKDGLVDSYEIWQVQNATSVIYNRNQIEEIVKNAKQGYRIQNKEIIANYPVFLTPGSKLQIVFDLDVLKEGLLKALSEKYFGSEGILKDFVICLSSKDESFYFKNRDLDVSSFVSELALPALASRRFFDGGSQSERMPNIEFWLGEASDNPSEQRIELSQMGILNLYVYHSMGSLDLALSLGRLQNTLFSIALLLILLVGLLYLYLLFNRHRLMIQTQHNFISSVSHEIKTPISVLKAAAENLKEGIVNDPQSTIKYGERMLLESDRLLNLTENVFRYAKLDSMQGLDKSIFQDLDFAEILQERIQFWSGEFANHSAKIERIANKGSFFVHGDRGALVALVDNLLSNALKHGINGGSERRVLLSLSNQSAIDTGYDSGDRVILSIKDFGPGISKKYQRLIFEPFYRPPRTNSNGIGLGLSLVKKIAKAHQGRVLVQSATGSGTLFEVHLPRIKP